MRPVHSLAPISVHILYHALGTARSGVAHIGSCSKLWVCFFNEPPATSINTSATPRSISVGRENLCVPVAPSENATPKCVCVQEREAKGRETRTVCAAFGLSVSGWVCLRSVLQIDRIFVQLLNAQRWLFRPDATHTIEGYFVSGIRRANSNQLIHSGICWRDVVGLNGRCSGPIRWELTIKVSVLKTKFIHNCRLEINKQIFIIGLSILITNHWKTNNLLNPKRDIFPQQSVYYL